MLNFSWTLLTVVFYKARLTTEKVIMFGWLLTFGEGYHAQLINRRIE